MSSSRVNLINYLIPLEEINRATEKFSQQRCIGSGGFGAVYKGQLSKRWQNRLAAIKRRGRDSYQGEREFRNELEMISRFHHENIISFIGYCDEENEMIIVYEYAINGSLDHHLQDPYKISCITWTQRLLICIGAARGLSYLHSGLGEQSRVIHRDVKSSNMLLDENFVVKICDFGLSKLGPRNQTDTQLYTRVAGTQFYVDPTYHESRILRKESDVYSFGVVLFEILSGMLVYHEKTIGDEQQFLMTSVRRYYKKPYKLIDPHIRDQIRSRSFKAFQEIAYRCISFNLMERPTMDKVIERIEEALSIQVTYGRTKTTLPWFMDSHPSSNWVQFWSPFHITYERSTSTSAVCSMIESAICKLNSINPDDHQIAAAEISILAKRTNNNRVAIAQAGAIPLLIHLLASTDSITQEHAVTAILKLSISQDNKGIIVSSGAIPGIIHVLKVGNMDARENAATTLFSLSLIVKNNSIIAYSGAIPPLVLLLSEGTQKGKMEATIALFNLCIYGGHKIKAVKAGVVPVLMELLWGPHGVLKDHVLLLLATLSVEPFGIEAIGKAGAVPVLVEIIGSGSPRMKDNAAVVLVKLCSKDQKYLVEAQELGVMEKWMDLLHRGRDRGNEKFGQLLKEMDSILVEQCWGRHD